MPVAVLMMADNHRPCRGRSPAETLNSSPLSQAPSSCSATDLSYKIRLELFISSFATEMDF